VVGHVTRDVVLGVDGMPAGGGTTAVRQRLEQPGGKGYNQALGLVQLGHHTALIAAVGTDRAGEWLRDQASGDGIDSDAITARRGRSSLVVSVVGPDGEWRYFEDLPDTSFVQEADIDANLAMIESAAAISLQLQEPWEAVITAARAARSRGRLVVADGAPDSSAPAGDLYQIADVLRADRKEAELMTDIEIAGGGDAIRAATRLQHACAGIVVVAAGADGNAVVWPGGRAVVPLLDGKRADTTGGGDALVAGLVDSLLAGADPLAAVCCGTVAAGSVVRHLGGRPKLSPGPLSEDAARLRTRINYH